ncbi:MAG: hypothetical protein FWC82_02400, partial [Firmicutes bacterium]|nr:hypothetical protein [Bacillota bacterium]
TVQVIVSHAIPASASILSMGNLIQSAGLEEVVSFVISFPDLIHASVSPETTVSWYANGNPINTAIDIPVSSKLYFTPSGQGSHLIRAVVSLEDGSNLETIEEIRVFEPFEVKPFRVMQPDALEQEEGEWQPLTFLAQYERVAGNPPPVIAWYVNDELAGTDTQFIFNPTRAGRFTIRLTINRIAVQSEIGDFEILILGESVPTNLRFDYHSNFPHLWFIWDSVSDESEGAKYSVTIETAQGLTVEREIEVTGNRLDLRPFIGMPNSERTIFNTEFRIFIRSLGGGIFLAGDYVEPLLTNLIPHEALGYLQRTFFNGHRNFYAASVYDLADMFAYIRLHRRFQRVIPGSAYPTEQFNAFIGFVYEDANQMVNEAFRLRGGTGLFNYQFAIRTRRHFSTTVTFRSDGVPSVFTTGDAQVPPFGSAIPTLNFDPDNAIGRAGGLWYGNGLPIMQRTRTVPVSTSDQLFFAAEEGFRPVPLAGSVAYRIFNQVKATLRFIISDDMCEVAKALAIHDYLMWRITYDHAAIALTAHMPQQDAIRLAVQHAAYYLEGVFGEGQARWFAVCDGIAKAFSLMANTIGLASYRIAGRGLVNGVWMGHAWNKVKVNGLWYNVDVTWGDRILRLPTALTQLYFGHEWEIPTRRYFLRTDAELSSTHREDLPNRYPPSTTQVFNFYAEFTFCNDNPEVDFFMNSSNYMVEANRLVDHMLTFVAELNVYNSIFSFVVGCPTVNIVPTHTEFISFHVRVHSSLHGLYNNITLNPLHRAFNIAGLNTTINGASGWNGNPAGRDYFVIMDSIRGSLYAHVFINVNWI